MAKPSAPALSQLKTALESLIAQPRTGASAPYLVPALWAPVGTEPHPGAPQQVEPAGWFLEHIRAVESHAIQGIEPARSLNTQLPGGTGGAWVAGSPIYNLFVRLGTAFDHDGDGCLGGSKSDLTLNRHGMRESGTLLKALALLGHVSRLGARTIHLLPVTAIGRDGNKGLLGSPYAIKNAYRLEPTLADPLVPLDVETQFRAFIEACHLLGIRVICEFVFRTASKDADWIAEHPDWFYWIDAAVPDRAPGETNLDKARAGYGNPIFDDETLKVVKQKVERGDFHELPPPPESYRRFFKLPPAKGDVTLNAQGQYRGRSRDPETGSMVETRIPGAFADWPPDDNQPPWGDVTYLRMFVDEDQQRPRFNYIGYNTIRMYDTALARHELANRPLWDKIRDLIPYYQQTFGIDGVMVDMGHAVPVELMQEIVDTARRLDPNFAFPSEDFSIEEKSVRAGYNAVVGYAWWVEYKREGLRDLLQHVGVRGVPLPWFGAVENHNTPRAAGRPGGERYARYAFLLNTMLPKSIPFIHNGYELGESMPVNTGLDFTNDDLARLAGKPLALFDLTGFDWCSDSPMTRFTRRVLEIRREYAVAVESAKPESFRLLETGNADVFAFVRVDGGKNLLVVLNRDLEHDHELHLDLGWCGAGSAADLLPETNATAPRVIDGRLDGVLKAGACHCFGW